MHTLNNKLKVSKHNLNQYVNQGFTLVELMIAIAIIGILIGIAIPAYQAYTERARVYQSVTDIAAMSVVIEHYFQDNREYPDTLTAVNLNTKLDPWGRPYRYLNLNKYGFVNARRDVNLKPLNTDFDLYSIGKDNNTAFLIIKPFSLDDVIRAYDGKKIDLASKF